jgi:probable rRNA maturation factor
MAPDEARRRLRVLVADERGRGVRASGLTAWLQRVAPARARGWVSIALVGDARIRALNRTYRGKDYATDVLSFPSDGTDRPRSGPSSREALRRRTAARPKASAARFLGDIVIGRRVAQYQARLAGHSEGTELRLLALHGLLHLLGYDHERDNGTMRRLEQRLRRRGGLSESLIERAGT